ncbi:MAG: aspartate aminotransferase family protein [Bacillota bacterium]
MSLEIMELYQQYLNPTLAQLLKLMGLDEVEVQATGVSVKSSCGQEYLDCLGGYGSLNFGHRPPEIIAAIQKQLDKLGLSSKLLLNQQQAEFAACLAELTPGDLKYTFCCNSGTEAVEGALKLARAYTKKPEIISATNSFHGKSLGALSATAKEEYQAPFRPLLDHFTAVPFGEIDALEAAITEQTAAVLLEPIQGEGGIILPPAGYLSEVRELCNQTGVLLIIDEIQTGLGRTGTNFAVEQEGIVPDIMTLAKSLGGGVMPLGALIAKEQVWQPFIESPFLHTSTFGGNPVATIAGSKALEILKRDKLAQQAAKRGEELITQLQALAVEYPKLITEVRGRGLMIGVELVDAGVGGSLISELTARNLLAAYTLNAPQVIRLEPPLIISSQEVREVVDIFTSSLAAVTEEIN